MSKDFETVWREIQSTLKPNLVIPNWTIDNGYFGVAIKISSISSRVVYVTVPTAKNIQVVSKNDFEAVWKVWADYKTGRILRSEVRELTRKSRYVINILHWLDQKEQ